MILNIDDFNNSEHTIKTWAMAILALFPNWNDPIIAELKSKAVDILNNPDYRKQQVKGL